MNGRTLKLAIILEAAGDARRFGRNKLLEPMADGLPMVSRILSSIRSLEAEYRAYEPSNNTSAKDKHVSLVKVMVTQYDQVAELADGFTVVRNNHPELGISLSMQLGIGAAGDADAYMFCVCDQPGLKASTIKRLIESYISACEKSDAPIVSLSWQGIMYNPKIFSSIYKEELMALSGDTGGRQIIKDHMNELILVEAGSELEIKDIDTPDETMEL